MLDLPKGCNIAQANGSFVDTPRNGGAGHELSLTTFRNSEVQSCSRSTPSSIRIGSAKLGQLQECKVGIRVVQVLLGHKRLETTSVHTHVATDLLHEVLSPLEALPPS